MFALDDTIAAIATPPGRGGIGVVRISGPSARPIAAALLDRAIELEPRRATFARIRGSAGRAAVRDEVVVTYFPSPASYTGQPVVEISAHGNPVVLEAIVRAAIASGARLARPGEFTFRAFLTGKRDLVQAEAVADLIAAATPAQARVACDQLEGTLTRRLQDIDRALFDLVVRLEASLDFPEEGYHFIEPAEIDDAIGGVIAQVDALLAHAERGRLIREGATVVIAGRPNVGKSSLFNALAGTERAIVTAVAGTTRDLLAERIDIEGVPVLFVDTAGARQTVDPVEQEGVQRATRAREGADAVVVVLDRTEPVAEEDRGLLAATANTRRVLVANKSDLAPSDAFRVGGIAAAAGVDRSEPVLEVSARTGEGLAAFRRAVISVLTGTERLEDIASISNVRHIALLHDARVPLVRAQEAARGGAPEEFLLTDLQAARTCFDEIVGVRTGDAVLREIFAKFCIGK